MIGSEKEIVDGPATEPRQKSALVKVLQLCLWGVLPLLLLLFLLYSVAQQEGPLYRMVSGTPVERYCLKALPYLWRHLSFLERQSMDASLSEAERRRVRIVLARMEDLRPTHSFRLTSGDMVFGRPIEESDTNYGCRWHTGMHWTVTEIPKEKIAKLEPIISQQEEFSTRNLRFLLSTAETNHYYLHPYLFATPSAFRSALRLHAYLSKLEDQIRSDFGPLVNESEALIYHVRILPDDMALADMAGNRGSFSTVNASAFYKKSETTLYLAADPAESGGGAPSQAAEWLTRHEGAHHIVHALKLLPTNIRLPFWIEEGFSQYCEREPMGSVHSDKLAYLQRAKITGDLIPWQVALTTPLELTEDTPEDRIRTLYAQSWLLYHVLLKKENRTGFLGFLSKLDSFENDWQQRQEILLGNHVGKTWTALENELTEAIDMTATRPGSPDIRQGID